MPAPPGLQTVTNVIQKTLARYGFCKSSKSKSTLKNNVSVNTDGPGCGLASWSTGTFKTTSQMGFLLFFCSFKTETNTLNLKSRPYVFQRKVVNMFVTCDTEGTF